MTTTTKTRLWVGLGGNVVCDQHAGASLKALIESNQNATTHKTTTDSWFSTTSQFIDNLPCETCVDWSTLILSDESEWCDDCKVAETHLSDMDCLAYENEAK